MQPYVEPGTKRIGDPIRLNAVIAEAGLPVSGARVVVETVTPTGAVHDLTLHDSASTTAGEYAGVFPHTTAAGNYRFTFRAEGVQAGKHWRRQASRSKTVVDPRIARPGDVIDPCCERLVRLLDQALRRGEPVTESDIDAPDHIDTKGKADPLKSPRVPKR
jgi:hypothetical protein